MQRGDEQQTGRRCHLLVAEWLSGRVETFGEPFRQLGEIGVEAETCIRVARVALANLDGRGGQQPVHLGHRRHQPVTLSGVEWLEYRGGGVVRALIEGGDFAAAEVGEPRGPHPAVGATLFDNDQPVALQRP